MLLRILLLNDYDDRSALLAYNFNQNPFAALTVKFTVKNLLPWTEMEFPFSYSNDYFSSHDLPF